MSDLATLLNQIKQWWLLRMHAPNRDMHKPILAMIIAMIATMHIDGMTAIINSTTTWIGQLPRDIREYVLRPMLWEGKRYLGFQHRDGYRYGVRDTAGQPYKNVEARCIVWLHMGTFHRDGNRPAQLVVRGPPTNLRYSLQYWEHGYLHRDSGPAIVGCSGFSYYQYGRLAGQTSLSAETSGFSIWFPHPALFEHIHMYDSGIVSDPFSIMCKTERLTVSVDLGADGVRLFSGGKQSDLISSPSLEALRLGLVAYAQSEQQSGRIEAEFARAQPEMAEAAALWAEL